MVRPRRPLRDSALPRIKISRQENFSRPVNSQARPPVSYSTTKQSENSCGSVKNLTSSTSRPDVNKNSLKPLKPVTSHPDDLARQRNSQAKHPVHILKPQGTDSSCRSVRGSLPSTSRPKITGNIDASKELKRKLIKKLPVTDYIDLVNDDENSNPKRKKFCK